MDAGQRTRRSTVRRGGGGVAGRWERPSSEGCDVVRRLERFRFCGGGCGGFVVEFTKTCRDGEDPIRWNLKTDPSTGRRCSTTNPGGRGEQRGPCGVLGTRAFGSELGPQGFRRSLLSPSPSQRRPNDGGDKENELAVRWGGRGPQVVVKPVPNEWQMVGLTC